MPAKEFDQLLTETVYNSIRKRIVGNQLKAGVKLTHQGLAEVLEVSRTPVREALERLHQEGYVCRVPRKGFFVAEVDVDDVQDLYQVREALEVYQLSNLFEQGVSKGLIAKLKRLNKQYKVLKVEKRFRERLELDREFHVTLAGATGNAYLAQSVASIFDRLILKRRSEGYRDHRAEGAYEEHLALTAALESGDTKLATQLLTQHIRGACDRLSEYLNSSE